MLQLFIMTILIEIKGKKIFEIYFCAITFHQVFVGKVFGKKDI